MRFLSTRNSKATVSGAQAIVKGISDDGGLFVPEVFPTVTPDELESFLEYDYAQRTAFIASKFLDEFSFDELLEFAKKAYSKFDGENPCPLVKLDDGLYVLELWHGPTSAFKDFALTYLPYLLVASKKKLDIAEETLILVATSGDTGKAALEGFKDVEGTRIIVFYPEEGVSDIQKLQMRVQEGDNVSVVGIKGNFDDAQNAVKKAFTDESFKKKLLERGFRFSSANSINFGRLLPQIVYYFSAYADLVSSGEIESGDKVNFVVPTGNFGNILAGYYAYKMGLNINKLIAATNSNNVVSDFFSSGKYDINRKFFKTISPSMDILISSNFERLVFEFVSRDDLALSSLYKDLSKSKTFSVDEKLFENSIFEASWADEEETKSAIFNFYDIYDYLLDTHTAVAASVYVDYSEGAQDNTPSVILSAASPYKFASDVYNSLGVGKVKDAHRAINLLELATGVEVPDNLKSLKEKQLRHNMVVEKEDTRAAIEKILGFETT